MGVKVAKVPKCERCSRRLRKRLFEDSVAYTSAGQITALVCRDCLTPDEFISSEITDALYDVGFGPTGLIMSRPKISER